ncbi:MAG: protein kinase, partial [Deltaproteobacteria bacterium]|nr:protein kinase [Deltaproteobacteria bacterium]
MASEGSLCIADHQLAEFAQGVVDEAELARLTQHLDRCGSCRRRAALAAAAVAALEGEEPLSQEPTAPALELTAPAALLPGRGERLGRYVVIDRLGKGGMGVVFRAHDPQLDRDVALKVLHPTAPASQAISGLLEEARIAARLVHPNVVTIHDVGIDQERAFVAMELVEGGTLAHWLQSGQRTTRQVMDLFLAAGEGLAAAHRAGLVHRDF